MGEVRAVSIPHDLAPGDHLVLTYHPDYDDPPSQHLVVVEVTAGDKDGLASFDVYPVGGAEDDPGWTVYRSEWAQGPVVIVERVLSEFPVRPGYSVEVEG